MYPSLHQTLNNIFENRENHVLLIINHRQGYETSCIIMIM
ncbi:hypothetical protein SACIG290_0162 [Staphylococcus aureus subsp. aureus CIG290]|nr:hypothetical protein SACIG290_0162 [Staphylococcus aureus subsp. aureus CIG290]